MTVYDTYSYRRKVAKGDVPDVFVYDKLPIELRVQIVHIWMDAIGVYAMEDWDVIHNLVAREHGVFQLYREERGGGSAERCESYLLRTSCEEQIDTDRVLDLIEVSFIYIDRVIRNKGSFHVNQHRIKLSADEAIDELNERFRRAGVGYRYENGQIVRIDSELIHREVVRPALLYLHKPGFEGPRDEFLKAHRHYRAGETKDAITNANKALESTLRVICDQRGWEYNRGARVSDLLKVIRSNGLFPDYLDTSFDQLVSILKSSLPVIRDRESAHGQGSRAQDTPIYVTAYALHLAAANILFLAEAHGAKK